MVFVPRSCLIYIKFFYTWQLLCDSVKLKEFYIYVYTPKNVFINILYIIFTYTLPGSVLLFIIPKRKIRPYYYLIQYTYKRTVI